MPRREAVVHRSNALLRGALLPLLGGGCADDLPLGFTVEVVADEVFQTPEQRAAAGLPFFPDGAGGILRDGDGYTLFFPNGGEAGDPRQGTHRFTAADLDTFEALVPSSPDAVLPSGTLQPGPDDFDRDYAGGGNVVRDDASGRLVHVYYGEFHWDPAVWLPFYGSNGLAVSDDGGLTWTKRGEVLRVRLSRDDRQTVGSVVSAVVRDGYVYLYYQDQDPTARLPQASVAVARAELAELEATGAAAVRKLRDGTFSEPGISGRFSPVAQDAARPQAQGAPTVAYDAHLDRLLLVHVVYERDGAWTLALRSSEDGLTWSEPTPLGDGTPENRLGYPMLVGLGDDPSVLGDTFQLYYVDRFGDWTQARWRRMTLRVGG